jgi:two-component system sensor histidine kinase KdpD
MKANHKRPRAWRGYALTTLVVAVASAAGALVRSSVELPDLVTVYLLAVVVAAARFGRGPSLLAATLSLVALDFFFIPPFYKLAVAERHHFVTFALMLVVGLLTSGLTLRIRRQEAEARVREERMTALYELSRDLASAVDASGAAAAITRHAALVLRGGAALYASPDEQLAADGPALVLAEADRRALLAAFRDGRPTGQGTTVEPDARCVFVPAGNIAVLAGAPEALGPEQHLLLEAFARQAALALERARLAHQAEAAARRAYTEEMRSSLLSAVSHDLRTPLAVITGAATTLRDGRRATGVEGELLDTICEEADRLERLVRNLLDMTRLQSGALEVRREWIPLEEIIGSALTRLDARLTGRPVRTQLPADLPLVSADALLLEQVLVNLLENAAKHTPGQSPVEITASADAEALIIDVADRGPGIPAGSESRIFEKFFRAPGARTPGAGLGLAICRGIVDAHGGSLVASNRPGGGALFRIVLPLGGRPPLAPPEADLAAS